MDLREETCQPVCCCRNDFFFRKSRKTLSFPAAFPLTIKDSASSISAVENDAESVELGGLLRKFLVYIPFDISLLAFRNVSLEVFD